MKAKLWAAFGLSLIILGFVSNPWLIAATTFPEGVIEWFPLKIAIWLLDSLLIVVGIVIVGYRRTDTPKKILVSLLSVIVALITLEFLLAVAVKALHLERPDFGRAGILYEFQRSTQYHPRWGWSFRPDVDSIWEEDWKLRERTRIRTSFKTLPIPGYPEYGMRDDGWNREAAMVIPVFGDSFTFGSTVEREEIWSELIESRNPEVDMLTLASGGGLTKAVEQYQILRDLLPPHDVVIYQMWLGNEFFDNYAFPKGQSEVKEQERAHVANTQKLRLQKASRLAYVVVEAIDNIQQSLEPGQDELVYLAEEDQWWDDRYGNFYLYPINPMLLRYAEPEYADERINIGIQNTEDALLRMKALAGERELIVILFPFKAQLYADIVKPHRPELDLSKPNRIVIEQCERHGITCIDTLPTLIQYKTEKLFWDYDPHFTKAGQNYASLVVEDVLKQQGVIPSK